MTKRTLITISIFVFLSGLLVVSLRSGEGLPQSIIVPYVHSMDIYLVRGNGADAQKFFEAKYLGKSNTNWGVETKKYDAYLSVHINPEQTRLIAAKATQERRGRILDNTSHYRLVSIDLANHSEEILLEAQQGEGIRCPQWSLDGTQIAFYKGATHNNNSGIFLWNIEAITVHKIFDIKTFYDSCEDMGTYFRWVDNDRLAVYHSGISHDSGGVWLINIVKLTSEKILGGRQIHIRPYYSITSKSFSQRISSLSEDVITALWGDVKNPRAAPYWSPDRKFVFYHVMREGFLSKRWIERYDPQTGKTITIKTVWWAIYTE